MATLLEEAPPQQFARYADNDKVYELVKGRQVESPPMGAQQGIIANVLQGHIFLWGGDHLSGLPVVEVLLRLGEDGPERRPDLAFVSFQRWPERTIPDVNAWPIVPDLAVEVVSSTNTAYEIQDRIDDYFAAGVRLVWVIYPPHRRIHVYESIKTIRVLDNEDTLDGGVVLPGFQLPVKKLFEIIPPV